LLSISILDKSLQRQKVHNKLTICKNAMTGNLAQNMIFFFEQIISWESVHSLLKLLSVSLKNIQNHISSACDPQDVVIFVSDLESDCLERENSLSQILLSW
jgi:hypothetical protein